ncbi:hypothetical protein OG948_36860 (plasmid) [Embleya sp. NBC_00888]|uniref:hypothetical protein n=1 Tax=Embleya sp. NBC_00888 TaxID=2975960 RepID=UPI002F916634|nr:hypothetical protein OG948_36860 [Embleya sp. NBC_00888]
MCTVEPFARHGDFDRSESGAGAFQGAMTGLTRLIADTLRCWFPPRTASRSPSASIPTATPRTPSRHWCRTSGARSCTTSGSTTPPTSSGSTPGAGREGALSAGPGRHLGAILRLRRRGAPFDEVPYRIFLRSHVALEERHCLPLAPGAAVAEREHGHTVNLDEPLRRVCPFTPAKE